MACSALPAAPSPRCIPRTERRVIRTFLQTKADYAGWRGTPSLQDADRRIGAQGCVDGSVRVSRVDHSFCPAAGGLWGRERARAVRKVGPESVTASGGALS